MEEQRTRWRASNRDKRTPINQSINQSISCGRPPYDSAAGTNSASGDQPAGPPVMQQHTRCSESAEVVVGARVEITSAWSVKEGDDDGEMRMMMMMMMIILEIIIISISISTKNQKIPLAGAVTMYCSTVEKVVLQGGE